MNVQLPTIPPPTDVNDQHQKQAYLESRMYDKHVRFAPVSGSSCHILALLWGRVDYSELTGCVQYVHDGKWWGRFSAQTFLEVSPPLWPFGRCHHLLRSTMLNKHQLSDFDKIAEAVESIFQEIKYDPPSVPSD